jgi:hypothetical protein
MLTELAEQELSPWTKFKGDPAGSGTEHNEAVNCADAMHIKKDQA